MVIAKTNPTGLDALINYMQKTLHDKLSALWNVDITAYPKCYVNTKTDEGRQFKTIEFYSGASEYENVIYAEGNKFFFIQTDDITPKDMQNYQTRLSLFFTVNLSDVKPDIVHRADEEVHNDVLNIINKISKVSLNRLVTDIQKVYSGFEYRENDDYHPYHCFKIELDVYYNPKDKPCP